MSDQIKGSALIPVLTWLGLIPFVFLVGVAWLIPDLIEHCTRGLMIYSSVIAVFLAGSQWGMALQHQRLWPWLCFSNATTLWICMALWFAHRLGLCMSGISFLAILWADYGLQLRHCLPMDYWRMRVRVTLCVLLVITIFMVMQ